MLSSFGLPCKGEVLNGLSNYWFHATEDIVANHLDEEVSPRSVLVKKAGVLPVEVVVRGYLTGSAWRDYSTGKGVSGIELPKGMRFNEKFEQPLFTPATKAERGEHDLPISSEEVVTQGLVEEKVWKQVTQKAHELYQRGSEMVAQQGLILVDTKYEFGIRDGEIVLVDEIHTPDSSRYWFTDTYEELFSAGEKQKKIDKEYLRQWLMEQGFMGEGDPPEIPAEIRIEVAWRYIQAYQLITGKKFQPQDSILEAERKNLLSLLS